MSYEQLGFSGDVLRASPSDIREHPQPNPGIPDADV
jgi:hypothetical protein